MKSSLSTKGSPWTALVLTGGGWPGDYDIVRSLGHEGVRSAVASSDPASIAFHSRFVERRIVLPPFERQNEVEILRQLLDIGSPKLRPVLYYVGDSELLFVAKYSGVLSAAFRFLLPDEGLLESITNKARFQDLAERYRLPVPRTIVVRSYDELNRRAKDIVYPCIVKPPYNRDWFWGTPQKPAPGYKEALRRFDSRKQLMEFCRQLPAWDSGILVQSYVEGGENQTISFLGYFNEHSQCLGSFVGRETRTSPPITGNPTFSEIIESKDLQLFSIATLERLGMKGIVKIDYVWDDNSGHFRMLEIEPHYQAWHLLGSYAGSNLAMVAYRHQRSEPVETNNHASRGSLLYFRPDLSGYLKVYRNSGKWPFRRYLQSLLECDCYRVLDPRDLKPFLASLLQFSRKLIRRLLQSRPWAEIITR